MKAELEAERQQLIAHWSKRFRLSPELHFTQVRRILAASNGDAAAKASLGDDLRHFHDKLGYMAKGMVSAGGLCAGAIFRTDRFIKEKDKEGVQARPISPHRTYATD